MCVFSVHPEELREPSVPANRREPYPTIQHPGGVPRGQVQVGYTGLLVNVLPRVKFLFTQGIIK